MKRVLIVGVSSFVGTNIARYLRSKYRVFGTYAFNPPKIDGVCAVPFLLHQQAPITELVRVIRPEAVIYCAAVVDNQKCMNDPTGSFFVNVEAPVMFARTANDMGARLVFLSTSKVFAGDKGNYEENDITSPQGAYGISKRQAEDQLLIFGNSFILRLGTIYGLGAYNQNSALLNRILPQLWNKREVKFISDEQRSFVAAQDVARATGLTIDAPIERAGIYHLSTSDKDTYYSFAKSVGTVFGVRIDHFKPIKGSEFSGKEALAGGARGQDLSLNGELFRESFSYRPHNVMDSLFEIRKSLQQGTQ